jgi:hypothetical protein
MSLEKISISDERNISTLVTPKVVNNETSGRVNINDLLARVREEKKKEGKINIVFFGLLTSLVFVAGLILSF